MNTRVSSRTTRSGYGLLEVIVTTFLIGTVFGAVALVGSAGSKYFRSSVSRAELEGRARRTLMRVQEELLNSDQASLSTFPASPLWDDRLSFQQPMGISDRDGEIDWRTISIEFRYDDQEVDDNIDNDGDGLVDEGMVVLVRDVGGPNEQEVVLCHGVSEFLEGEDPTPDGDDDNGNGMIDERGFCLELNGDSLAIRLTLVGRHSQGHINTRTFETAVWLRN